MKPPICYLCNRSLDSVKSRKASAGDVVQFADYTPLPAGMCGHPHGLEWFCAEHIIAAQALSRMSVDEAMLALSKTCDPPEDASPRPAPGQSGFFSRWVQALRKYFSSPKGPDAA